MYYNPLLSKTMRNVLPLALTSLLFIPGLAAQITSGKLTYNLQATLGDTYEALPEANGDSLEMKFVETFMARIKQQVAKQRGVEHFEDIAETRVYSFDSSRARIEGGPIFRTEFFSLYYFADLTRVIYRRPPPPNEASIRVDTLDYKLNGSNRTYEVQIYPDSIYQLGEFSCYKATVLERSRTSTSGEVRTTHYELYLTSEIRFSPSILLEWSEHIFYDCPVYIRSWIDFEITNYNEWQLVEFQAGVDEAVFKAPEE